MYYDFRECVPVYLEKCYNKSMQEQFKQNIEKKEYEVSEPILITDQNQEELIKKCLPLLNQFAPESSTKSFFTQRTNKTYVILVETKETSTEAKKAVGISGFKIEETGLKDKEDRLIKVLYISFAFIIPEVRGGGQYTMIQGKIESIANKEDATYQVLRTQNGRVWETANKSFSESNTYPNPKISEERIPEQVTKIAQYYNLNSDGSKKPMKNLVTIMPFYNQLAPVERGCKDPENTNFLENLFREADKYFKEQGLVDKNKPFEGIESTHPYSTMVISKFK